MNTATFRRELQNRLDADSMLDLVVFGQHAADTIADFRLGTTAEHMKLDTAATAIPATGFNVESVEHRSLELTVRDIGGQEG